jgi:hypothetical protein
MEYRVMSLLRSLLSFLHSLFTFLRRLLDTLLGVDIPWFFRWSGFTFAGIVFFILVREFWRTRQLLRRARRPWPFLTTLSLVLLGAEARSLYKVARLRIESEVLTPLDPRPKRIEFPTAQKYRDKAIEWSKDRRQWKQDRSGQLRRLVRSGESTARIEIINCTPLIEDEDIELYFNALATQYRLWDLFVDRGRRFSGWLAEHRWPGGRRLFDYLDTRGSDLLSGEELKFLSKVVIGSGFVAPLHLLTGLLGRYEESWEDVSEEYGRSVIRVGDRFRYSEIRKTQATILSLWLVWGPSIPVCTCPEWDGDVLLQYGFVDEDNSISLRCSSPEVLRKLDRPNPDEPRGLALAARVTGTLRWGPALRASAICPAQHAIWHDDRLVLDVTEGDVKRAGGTIEQVYASLYSAYLWIAFAMCDAETGEPFHPDEKWNDLIPFFEHANIADGDTYDFHTSQLACAAVDGALRLLRLDKGLLLRFVCAVDESGCGYNLPYAADATKTIRMKMTEFGSTRRDPAMRRLRLAFDPEQPWKDGDYSACALPDILKAYYDASETMPKIVEVQIADKDHCELLRRFYRECYMAEFPDPNERESLKNIQDSLRKKETHEYGANNYHVLIAVDGDGAPVGGSICDYFHKPNAGVIEYILVKPGLRKSGLGSQLLHTTESILANDALNNRGTDGLDWVVAEVDDPYLTRVEAQAFDPFARARIWDRWGYRILDFPYIQPALSKAQQPLYNLKLMVKPFGNRFTDTVPAGDVRQLLLDYIRLAMRKKHPENEPGFVKMNSFLSSEAQQIALLPVGDYIGWDKRQHVSVNEVLSDDDQELAHALQVYPQLRPDTGAALSADELRKYAGPNGLNSKPGYHYHLWTMRIAERITGVIAEDTAHEGVASFLTMPSAGFGHLGFTGWLRDDYGLHEIVRRIEERMVRDHTHAQGWYVECDADPTRAGFTNPDIGFHELDVNYLQPRLKGDDRERSLHLLYKPFGRVYEPPTIPVSGFLKAVKELHRSIYRHRDCDNAFRILKESLRKQRTVPIKANTTQGRPAQPDLPQ